MSWTNGIEVVSNSYVYRLVVLWDTQIVLVVWDERCSKDL